MDQFFFEDARAKVQTGYILCLTTVTSSFSFFAAQIPLTRFVGGFSWERTTKWASYYSLTKRNFFWSLSCCGNFLLGFYTHSLYGTIRTSGKDCWNSFSTSLWLIWIRMWYSIISSSIARNTSLFSLSYFSVLPLLLFQLIRFISKC